MRRQVLLHHDDRVRALDGDDDAGANRAAMAAESTESRLKVIRHRIRGRAPAEAASFFNVPRPETAIDDVCGSGRCFLHFTLNRGELVAFWVTSVNGSPEYGQIEFPMFDTQTAIAATSRWLGTESVDDLATRQDALLEIIGIASDTVAPLLLDALVARGVTDLVISPTWFLELWPLHCAEVNVGERRVRVCDVFKSVTYSPSFRILVDSIRKKRRGQGGLTAVGYYPLDHPIPNVDRELAAIKETFCEATILRGEGATPHALLRAGRTAAILHVACHGEWHAGDILRSGLVLHGDPWYVGKLYLPLILAEGDFENVDLVVLAACSSGRNLQIERTFTNTEAWMERFSFGVLRPLFRAFGRSTISVLY